MEHPLRAYEYDTDKHQLYLNNYVRHFQHLAHQHIKLLELGVLNGGSLLLWRDYFQDGQIVGLDLNRVNIDDRTGRIRVYQGDQRDLPLLTRIAGECAPDGFDIIIDDASHIAEFAKISFWHLFENHLNPGGYYVIEDWRVGYSELWPDGAKYKWPDPTQDSPRQFSQPSEHKSQSPHQNYRKVGLGSVARLMDKLGMDAITNRARMLYRKSKYKSHFPSHDYGMVGLIKQLIDELGMDQIPNPDGSPSPQRLPKFQRMEVCPGQVFIVKATKQDHLLVAEQLCVTSRPRNSIRKNEVKSPEGSIAA
jgi:hypothetical protein